MKYILRFLFILVISFPVNRSSAQELKLKDLHKEFDSYINKNDFEIWMEKLSAYPHHLGSGYDKTNALFIDSLFKSWGFDSYIEEFKVLFPTPNTELNYLSRL
jgi:N-acetylated-alpha-linked acidic dipeptidase